MLFDTVTEATQFLAKKVLRDGTMRRARSMSFTELNNVSWEIRYPNELIPKLPSRKIHPFQLMAETLWVLSGHDRIAFLKHYIPSAANFSDDGMTWPGAYGPRLCEAVRAVVEVLTADTDTRRAYIPIHYPSDLNRLSGSRDIPCNVGIQFYRSGQHLHLVRFCRSNDLLFGYAINHFEFTVLLNVVCAMLSGMLGDTVLPGSYFNHVTSLHVYEDKYAQAKTMSEEEPTECDFSSLDYDQHDEIPLLGQTGLIAHLLILLEAAWGVNPADGNNSLMATVFVENDLLTKYVEGMQALENYPRHNFVRLFYALLWVHLLCRKGELVAAGTIWQKEGLINCQYTGMTELVDASRGFLVNKDNQLASIL